MGDFLGFTFGRVHSSDLGITRVSGGDRYDEQLHPEIKDRTAEVRGVNGEYYFGSDFGPRQFDIKIAYDSLTEEQFRNLRKVFGTKNVQKLVFNERPYKYYLAKLESPIELSYICFDEPIKTVVGTMPGDERYGVRRDPVTRERERIYPYEVSDTKHRVYKGEGSLTFICYFPFAKSVYRILPEADVDSDWAVSSGIKTAAARGIIDTYVSPQEQGDIPYIPIYNPGDIATGIRMYIPETIVTNHEINLIYDDEYNNKQESLLLKQMII